MQDNIYTQAPVTSELMRLGFGFLDYLQEPGLLIRYSASSVPEGTPLQHSVYLVEVVPIPVPDELWPRSRRTKKLITKWWKNSLHKKAIREMLLKFELLSPDVPQQFCTDAGGKLVPGSVKKLTEIT